MGQGEGAGHRKAHLAMFVEQELLAPLLLGTSLIWLVSFAVVPYKYITDLHGAGAAVFSVLSLSGLTPEALTVAWSWPYFAVDLVKCAMDRDVPFFVHHALSLLVAGAGYNEPQLGLAGKGASRVMLIEWSALMLAHWNRDRSSRGRYVALVVGYFFNRIVYLGHLVYFAPDFSTPTTGREAVCLWTLRLLHALMCVWFAQLLGKRSKYSWSWHGGSAAYQQAKQQEEATPAPEPKAAAPLPAKAEPFPVSEEKAALMPRAGSPREPLAACSPNSETRTRRKTLMAQ